jgi:nitroimidazol reductase NimA-like FMN-containing flavoprotein (pyridoxamine 5'-phosphate oxidase superfamily)
VPAAVVTRHVRLLRAALDDGWLAGEAFDAVHVLRSGAEIDATTIARATGEGVQGRPGVRGRRATAAPVSHDGAMSETTSSMATEAVAGSGAAAGAARTTDIGPKTDRTRIRRKPDRAVPEHIEEILREGRVAHVAFVHHGEPRVIPFLYGYEAGRIVLHGAPGSSTLRELRDGRPVAVSVTILDALVASRDAETHSANYRSVVAYGAARRITAAAEKRRLLDEMTARYFPGRTVGREYTAATEPQIKAMEVIEVVVEEAAAKARSGPPLGPRDADATATGTAGIYPPSGIAPD